MQFEVAWLLIIGGDDTDGDTDGGDSDTDDRATDDGDNGDAEGDDANDDIVTDDIYVSYMIEWLKSSDANLTNHLRCNLRCKS